MWIWKKSKEAYKSKEKPLTIEDIEYTLALNPIVIQTVKFPKGKKYALDRLQEKAERIIECYYRNYR